MTSCCGALVDIVAERTGYPEDMLGPELDLEADLSIDSIKRVEIIGDVAERIGLPGGAGGGIDESVVEELAQLKTLAGIVDWIASAAASAPAPGPSGNGSAAARPVLSRDDLLAALVDIVAERTGYPEDMLAPGLDLEADLSIDSIKRVEIIGDVAERIGLPGGEGGLDESVVEELAQLKTLAGIVDWIASAATGEFAGPEAAAAASAEPVAEAPADEGLAGEVPDRSLRCVVEVVDAPAAPGAPPALSGATLVVTDDGSGVAAELAARLAAAGAAVTTLGHAELLATVSNGSHAAPLAVSGLLGEADGVIHLALATTAGAPAAFAALAPGALGRARWLAAVTPVAPPLVDAAEGSPGTGGEAGLVRSLSFEAPDAVVRHIAVDPSAAPDVIAALVVDELGQAGPLDVAHVGERRLTRAVAVTDRAAAADAGRGGPGAARRGRGAAHRRRPGHHRPLRRGPGPRRGRAGRAGRPHRPPHRRRARRPGRRRRRQGAAGRHPPRRPRPGARRGRGPGRAGCRPPARCGPPWRRSRPPGPRPPTTRPTSATPRRSPRWSPASTSGTAGSTASLHGAGIIEDRFLRDKTPESYARVYETKVAGARALLGAVRDDVGFVVLFGSVSGVFGNKGQVDYAAANDALDALAHGGAGGRLAGRVLSIDWGPWGGTGMVSDELAREYARRGGRPHRPRRRRDRPVVGAGRPARLGPVPRRPGRRAAGAARDARRAGGDMTAAGTERDPIAVVGLGCVYPGAADLDGFWRNVTGAVDAIGPMPEDRFDPELFGFETDRGGFVDGDGLWFDAGRFGVMPRVVRDTEPDQFMALVDRGGRPRRRRRRSATSTSSGSASSSAGAAT